MFSQLTVLIICAAGAALAARIHAATSNAKALVSPRGTSPGGRIAPRGESAS